MAELIFVTGASGFLAAHIIHELVEQGYRVRATARPKKSPALRSLYTSTPSVEIVEVPDIARGAFPDLLAGVSAVLHVASPLPGREGVDSMIDTAVQGSLNVLRQAEAAGVRRVVVTSSIVAVVRDPGVVGTRYRAEHWNPVTRADVTPENETPAYAVAKKEAERAVWRWAEAHPHVDVTTINPPYLYGPFASPSLRPAPGDFFALSTDLHVLNLITPGGTFPSSPGYADVRDVARAHVGALRSPPAGAGEGERKRVVMAAPHAVTFGDVLRMIGEERPQVRERLIKADVVTFPYDRLDLDYARIEEVTGVKKGEFRSLKETFLDTVDALLEVEKEWLEAGYVIKDVPVMEA